MAQVVDEKMIARASGRLPSSGQNVARVACVILLCLGILGCYYLWLEIIFRRLLFSRFDDTPMMNQAGPDFQGDFRLSAWLTIAALALAGGAAYWLKHRRKFLAALTLLIASVVAMPVMDQFFKAGILLSTLPQEMSALEPEQPEKEPAPAASEPAESEPPPADDLAPPAPTPDMLPGTGLPEAFPSAAPTPPPDAPELPEATPATPAPAPPEATHAPEPPKMRVDEMEPPTSLPFQTPTPVPEPTPLPSAGGAGT